MRDAKENREKKMAGRNPGGEERALLAPRISRCHFFLAVFFRFTHDGLSERGTTRTLINGRLAYEVELYSTSQ